ncbi:MAG: Cna protein B-type domain protein [Acidobacteria bacterium]|nr:Cna protein B-type domain protein [Acidobacteriota bacterium]
MKFSILRTKVLLTLVMMLCSVVFIGTIYAQSGTSTLNGTITDQAGAAVPGASVRLVNPITGFNRTVTTNEQGVYSFPSIPPATYQIEVVSGNFKKTINSNVQALVDKTTEINIALEPGDVSVVVDVTTNTIDAVVNTQDATIGHNFVPEQITQLPTDLRRVADLLSLQPGVTKEGYVAGGRSDQANVTLDGVDINDQQTGGRTNQFQTSQGTVLRLTTEAVEEFRITTTNANANQGRSSGAQVSLITKSGTNEFRGSAFYFYRPTAFSANSFFNNLAGVARPSLARDTFGGSIGGPIVKDRAFFFYSYEGQREQQDVSVVRIVPLASLGMGQLKFMGAAPGDPAGTNRLITLSTAQLNSIYSGVGINPAAVAVFSGAASRYAANDTSVGDGLNTGGFRFNAATTVDENTHIARFDINLTSTQALFVRGNFQNDLIKGVSAFPDTPATGEWSHPYGYVAGHTWTINNSLVNNFRYGMTRQAFSTQGDSNENSISFRSVYSPYLYTRTLSRVTPIHNFTNDLTWIKGNHTFQFGGNVRIIRNKRVDLGNAYDDAVTNPSFYAASGRVIDQALTAAGYTVPASQRTNVQNAATALIGRFSQYSGNFTFDLDGSVLPQGTPTTRNFSTEEYDLYGQDIWKPFRNLTLTLGLRYGLSRPVYEKNGFQVVPKERLGDFFERRAASAARGVPLNDLIEFELAGPKNGGQGFYSMDWNNFQPRVAAAWTPNFDNKYLRGLFGKEGESVIRGGFAITNDYFGQQLAVSFDALSSIGFTSQSTISANTYNITTNPAPRFTGFGQNIRTLPGVPAPTQRFSTEVTAGCLAGTEDCPQRIESSLDGTIVSPTNYTWNVSYGRRLPAGMYFEATYTGRKARNLLAARDVNALNNLVDPRSGSDWYTAAGMLHDLRARNVPITSVPNIPYFQNLFPGIGGVYSGNNALTSTQEIYNLVSRDGFDILDWTYVQLLIDDLGTTPNLFFHPQYAAFSAFSSVAKSDYHGGAFSLRQRLGETLSYDVNYTFSKSMDNASGLQTGSSYGSQFILNPLRPQDNYAVSDFDIRHVVNANFLLQAPIGRGRQFFSNMNRVADAFLGGWQLSGVYRWNSGLPLTVPFDAAQWATNWNAQSAGTRIRNVDAPTVRSTRNLFSDPVAAFASFRNARPGETGERNALRLPGYSALDLGLGKSFKMPWRENHKLQVRWEVFNALNHQSFDADNITRATFGLPQDPDLSPVNREFGKIFTGIQGAPRRMQFGLRYSF